MIWSWLRRLLMILAVVGMVIAPAAAPTGAGAMAAGVATMSPEMAMSAGMPCCADQQHKQMPDCGKMACPFIATCMVKCFASESVTISPLPAPIFTAQLIGLPAQAQLSGLAPLPPQRPPQA